MSIESWIDDRTKLVDVAMGRADADIVIKNGQWVSVQSGEIIPGCSIAISGERIAYVGPDASHTVGPKTEVIDAEKKFLVPGLLDAHMHVESGMITVTEFVRAVAPRGTTGMFIDPHEIANVFGLDGVKLMVDEAADQPIHVWVQVPSCVPSAPGLETPGSSITPDDVATAMGWEGIIGLGEMMNFPGVFMSDRKMLAEMGATAVQGKTIGGHYASFDLGLPFHGYVAGGAEDDHEGTRKEDAIARVRQGMKVMMRLGSAWHDVAVQVKAVLEDGLDPRHFILCTDDSHSETLVKDGHMDRVVRHAIEEGVPPIVAIQMATINTAEHFRVDRDMGMIAPGRYADVLERVFAKGTLLATEGNLLIELDDFTYPEWATNSINLGKQLTAKDFEIKVENASGVAACNVIGIVENQAPTRHLKLDMTITNGSLAVDIEKDIAKIALVERHKGTGGVEVGLVSGFGFTESCGIATTVAHDSHHMIVVGTNESDMALAANKVAEINGGQVVIKDGEVVGVVELPIAGLMSNERAQTVAEKAATVLDGFVKCGCSLNNPNMQLSLLALVVIPELRISDLGLVDVTKFEFVPLVESVK